MPSFDVLIPELTQLEWIVHGMIFAINALLFVFAKPLLDIVERGREGDSKVTVLRYLNVLVMVLQLLDLVLLSFSPDYQHYFIKAGVTLMALYASLLLYSIMSFLVLKKFGMEKELDEKKLFVETYSSRLVDIVLLIMIVISSIYALIVIWGANSLLETTGIFGIIFAFLAFTSSVWAPDIISGLIILNTQMLEDGDVVVVDGYSDEYIINKVSFIYIILYDIRNNHRTLVKNSRFIQSKIDNLSRIASTDGIRKRLVYHIGYPQFEGNSEQRLEALKQFKSRIEKLFQRAFESACEDNEIKINRNKPFESALTNTGNYALEYSVWFYLERIPNSKITATIRRHLMGTIYRVNEAIYTASVVEGIDLSTPDLAAVTVRRTQTAELVARPV
ncbi:MAG: hypothetical protein ACI9WS_002187 [Paraglaciecola psychrophila]